MTNLLPQAWLLRISASAFTCLYGFFQSMAQVLLLISLVVVFANNSINAQNGFCLFDELHTSMLADPLFEEQMEINEELIHGLIEQGQQSIMNGTVYTIPLVFHVIHLGEPVGVGSNISDSQLLQALSDLNNEFRNGPNDVEIEFCLAERDPNGAFTTGFNRVNGSGISDFSTYGITTDNGIPGISVVNEAQVKALSIWPNTDYVNVWVVPSINGPSSGIAGYAYFPGAPASLDGIVLRSTAAGVASQSKIFAHEAGHYLNLFHTFHEGDATTCPPNTNCSTQGDRVCDTPPHLYVLGGCNDMGTNTCDGGSSNSLYVYNHMSYSDNSCVDEFTDGQILRMRSAFMTLRPELMNSLGCLPSCTDVVASFTASADIVEQGISLTFTNSSTGATNYTWSVEGQEFNSTDLTYIFQNAGIFTVCLLATDSSCTNQFCMNVFVKPMECPEPMVIHCNFLFNGNLEITSILPGTNPGDAHPPDNGEVCNWVVRNSTPYFCSDLPFNTFGLNSSLSRKEGVISETPMNLTPGEEYLVTFDYYVRPAFPNAENPTLEVGLAINTDIGLTFPADRELLLLEDLPFDDNDEISNIECPETNVNYNTASFCFEYNDGDGQHLYFINTNNGNASAIFVTNISVVGCGFCDLSIPCSDPDFGIELEGCEATFSVTTSEPGAELFWDFGNGITANGSDVVHEFPFGGEFSVCLTQECDSLQTTSVICKDVIIPDSCNQCDTLDPISAVICESVVDSANTYLANFSFEVPKRFGPCSESLYISSSNVQIILLSDTIYTDNLSFDVVEVSVSITSPASFSLLDSCAMGYITLCSDSSQTICRQFTVCGRACDVCASEVSTTANCVSLVQNSGIYTYQGSVTVTVPPGATPCDITAEEVGFHANVTPASTTTWTVDYTIVTTNANLTNTSALLCFIVGIDVYCYPLNITLLPCIDPPVDCVAEWMPKEMVCSGVENDSVIFNIQKCVYGGAYEVCEGFGLFGTVDGNVGWVEVNSGGVVFTQFCFDIDIKIPVSEFTSGQLYDLKLYLCDANGEMVCYYFPFKLICEDTDAGGGERSSAGAETPNPSVGMYFIQPNPARYQFTVVSRDFDPAVQRTLRILDHTGRTIKASNISLPKEEVSLVDYPAGVYFVSILEEGVPVYFEKLVIVR